MVGRRYTARGRREVCAEGKAEETGRRRTEKIAEAAAAAARMYVFEVSMHGDRYHLVTHDTAREPGALLQLFEGAYPASPTLHQHSRVSMVDVMGPRQEIQCPTSEKKNSASKYAYLCQQTTASTQREQVPYA